MAPFAEFADILKPNEPLAPKTSLGVGGPAEFFCTPRTADELSQFVAVCAKTKMPYRILGGGTNILVPDEGVEGVVISLAHEAFGAIQISGNRATAGAGALLADLIMQACSTSASGLESLVGIPGTVGGAVRNNAGDRLGDIGQHVYCVDVMDRQGVRSTRMRADIRFGYRQSNLDDVIILSATFDLEPDSPELLNQRIKKIWIAKKASQPFGFERSGYVFKNPRGLSAVELIEQAGLGEAKVGGAELSPRDPRFVIAQSGATSKDVARLIEMVREKVLERSKVQLELQIDVW